jgi:hypothetical protein
MICLINCKLLCSSFIYDPTTYKGIRIGDVIKIPESQSYNLDRRMVVVTGFTKYRDHEGIKRMILWRSPSIYPLGGFVHSSTYYDEIEQHIKINL